MILQDVRKMQLKHTSSVKPTTTKKANACKIEERDYVVFLLQVETDHQSSKIPFRDFHWVGPYVVEKISPNSKYFVRKIETNKTHVLHHM